MNVIVRAATLADADTIVEFNRLLAKETENKDIEPAILAPGVRAMLKDPHKGRYYVALPALSASAGTATSPRSRSGLAKFENEVVGQLGITLEWSDWRNGNFWWIQSVYVAKPARRHGVFRSLYQHVLAEARSDPTVIGLRLYVEHDNAAAQATYRNLGMMMTGYQVMEELFATPGGGASARQE